MAQLTCPPEQVWRLVSTHEALTVNQAPTARAFALPGPRERWCVADVGLGGALLGALVEVLEREEGCRVVTRSLSERGQPRYDWRLVGTQGATGSETLVRVRVTANANDPGSQACQAKVRKLAEDELGWAAHRLVGAPPPAPVPGGMTAAQRAARRRHAECPLEEHDVRGQVVVPLPPEIVWAGLLDASTFSLTAIDGERAAVVPGTPAGEVGELRAIVSLVRGLPYVTFHEVVEIGPGPRLVLRGHSASHPPHLFTEVEPHPQGSMVRATLRLVQHRGSGMASVDLVRTALAEYLGRLRLDLVTRAAG
ncbi:MAG: hypothetical protein KQH57_09835 [Actinomycetales bacterium]|nr:hypothetical protein [Actinomycetales bacterium]